VSLRVEKMMNLNTFGFLANPTFVVVWYTFGLCAAGWAIYDMFTHNRNVMPPLKAAWPIIVIFFSIIGLLFYFWTCRPWGISSLPDDEAKRVHHGFVSKRWTKVIGSVIHCVGGDGLGIITAMTFTRLAYVSFWPEFWIEYAVGFAFGWLIFQYWGMHHMGNTPLQALWKGFRAEFFSMMTVMIGMGFVMRYVTPAVISIRPLPDSAAFWGLAAFGLLTGAILTFPMNWWMVAVGWKHGMG